MLLTFVSLVAHNYDALRECEGMKFAPDPQNRLCKFLKLMQARAAAFKKYYKADQVEKEVTTIKQLMQPATHLYVKRFLGYIVPYEHHILGIGAEYYEDDLVSFIKLLIPKK